MEQEKKNDKLLEVRDLKVSFFTPAGEVKAVNGISYDVNYDEVMGVVGESVPVKAWKHILSLDYFRIRVK